MLELAEMVNGSTTSRYSEVHLEGVDGLLYKKSIFLYSRKAPNSICLVESLNNAFTVTAISFVCTIMNVKC